MRDNLPDILLAVKVRLPKIKTRDRVDFVKCATTYPVGSTADIIDSICEMSEVTDGEFSSCVAHAKAKHSKPVTPVVEPDQENEKDDLENE